LKEFLPTLISTSHKNSWQSSVFSIAKLTVPFAACLYKIQESILLALHHFGRAKRSWTIYEIC